MQFEINFFNLCGKPQASQIPFNLGKTLYALIVKNHKVVMLKKLYSYSMKSMNIDCDYTILS